MAVIVQIDGYDPVAAAAVSVYAGSHDDPTVCHYNGQTWWPVLGKLPTLRYDLFDGAFTGQITAPSSSLSMQTEPWPDFGRYILADGRLRMWTGGPDDSGTWTLRFDGRVTGQPNVINGTAQVDFAVDDRWLDTALLTTYAGTTGAEGPAGLKGQAKPLAIGAPRYAPGKLIDSVNSVLQVSAYGSVVSFDTALERLARFSTSVADYASYAALVAASIPPGRWASAKAVGMARFGAPPVGQISFLLQGDNSGADGFVRKPGAITRRIAGLAGGSGKTDDTSLTALDTARPYNLSIYLEDQTTARGIIQNLAASVNAVAGVSWTGKLFALPVAIGTATITLAADGSALPPVARVEQIDTASPWQKLAITAERTWAVHALADIAFTAALSDVGNYASGTTYREGNIVSLTDGSRWLYTAATPTSGNAPAGGSAFWSSYSAATQPDFASVTGATKPDDNADVTADNVASAIAGQAAWATYVGSIGSVVAPTSNLFAYPRGTLDGRSAVSLGWTVAAFPGASNLHMDTKPALGGGYYTQFRTSGVAATPYSFYDTTFDGSLPFSASLSAYANSAISLNAYVEFLNAGGAVIGTLPLTLNTTTGRYQGSTTSPSATTRARLVVGASFAASSGTYQDYVFFAIKVEASPTPTPYTDDSASIVTGDRIVWNSGVGLNALRPAEANSDVTAGRTAAAVAGQTAWATYVGSINSLVAPASNLFPYPRGTLDGRSATAIGWNLGSFPGSGDVLYMNTYPSVGGGYYEQYRTSGAAATPYAFYDTVFPAGLPFSASLSASATNAISLNTYVEFINAGGAVISSLPLTLNTASGRYQGSTTAPTGTTRARVVIGGSFAATSGTYQGYLFWAIKVEASTAPTPFTEDANSIVTGDRIVWSSGVGLNALRPGEFNANNTEGRVAAGISEQGAFATRSSVGYGSSFLTGFGQISPLDQLFFGDGFLRETNGGAAATLANFKTPVGTAAAIAGQTAWATYVGSIGSVVAPTSNLFAYPRGTLDGRSATALGWTVAPFAGGSTLEMYSYPSVGGGYYVQYRTNGAAATPYCFYDTSFVGTLPFSASLSAYTSGGLSINPYVEFLNAGGAVIGAVSLLLNTTTGRYEGSTTAPSGTNRARVVIGASFAATSGTYQEYVFWGIKVEASPTPTPYTDDSASIVTGDRIVWNSGVGLNALRPAEANSDVTAGRTAAAIAGQTGWATYTGSVGGVIAPGTNVFAYPRGTMDGRTAAAIGWSVGPFAGASNLEMGFWQPVGGGYYTQYRTSGAAATPYCFYDTVFPANFPFSASANARAFGQTSFQVYVDFLTPSGVYISGLALTLNATSGRWEGSTTTPAETGIARFTVQGSFPATSGSYQDYVFWGVKIESSSAPTPFTEDANSRITGERVVWNTGVGLNALRPGEINANNTEGRVAAGIAGQGFMATQNFVDLGTRVTGRVPNSLSMNASNSFGLRALSIYPTATDSVSGGLCYLNVTSSVFSGDWGGTVTYPAASWFGPVSFNTPYYIWRNVSGPSDAGSSYGYSTSILDALGVNKVYLVAITTRASAGSGGSTGTSPGDPVPSGGGGGGGGYQIP